MVGRALHLNEQSLLDLRRGEIVMRKWGSLLIGGSLFLGSLWVVNGFRFVSRIRDTKSDPGAVRLRGRWRTSGAVRGA